LSPPTEGEGRPASFAGRLTCVKRGKINMTKQKTPLTKKHLLGYGLGDFGGCMTFGVMGGFMTRYYVNVALIDTALLAVLTLIWKVCDALCNPVIGMAMDRSFAGSRSKAGKYRPWILRVAPLLAVTGILVFTAPNWVTGASRLVVVFTTYLVYEFVYAMHNISYGSLISAMATDDGERAALSSARGVGGMLGINLTMVVFPIILSAFESNPSLGYGLGITLCAAVGFVACLLCYFFTEERSERNPAGKMPAQIRVTDILDVLRRNRAFLALCIHGLLQSAVQAVNSALGTYMYSDVLGNMALMSVGTAAGIPVSLVLLSLAPKISRKIGLEKMIRLSLLLSIGLYVGLFALHILTDISPWVHIAINAIAYGVVGLGVSMQWGLLGDTIEYNEFLTGKRTEGSINGTFNMLRRLGQAIGSSFGVAVLGLIGYDALLAVQDTSTILGIKVLCLLLPALFSLGSWAVFKFLWNITPEVRRQMAEKKG